MRLGIIAPEAPPEPGGMQEHAKGLLSNLPSDVSIELFTRPGLGFDRPNIRVRDELTDRFLDDLETLRRCQVDAWLTLNAAGAAYHEKLTAPLFAYVHGKDGLDPWFPTPPLLGRVSHKLGQIKLPGGGFVLRQWRMRRISEGLGKARHIFANSAFTKGVFERTFGLPSSKFTVVPPGIDEKHLQPIRQRADGPLRLFTVARLTSTARRKNVDGVLEALASLKDDLDFRYEVAGAGDDLPRLQALAITLGIAGWVNFLGTVSDEELRAAYRRADVFVLAVRPDATDVEGFGMVYAEAAAAGVPSIAVGAGGVPDAVRHGETGILIEDASPLAIAEAIRSFDAVRPRYSPARIQAFARSITSVRTTALVWERIRALV